jgi:hypothetical protein
MKIKPQHHDEIVGYICKRVQMILNKNIQIISVNTGINSTKTKIKIYIYFNYMKVTYKFYEEYTFNIIILDSLINNIILDFEYQLLTRGNELRQFVMN